MPLDIPGSTPQRYATENRSSRNHHLRRVNGSSSLFPSFYPIDEHLPISESLSFSLAPTPKQFLAFGSPRYSFPLEKLYSLRLWTVSPILAFVFRRAGGI